jgi:phosphopantetheine adenylyltransferase
MIENGKNAEVSTFDIEENYISSMYQKAKTIFMQRLNSMRDEVTRNNNLLVEGRVASLKMTYNKKIQQKQKQLVKGVREKKDQRYLNMLTAQIKRWTNELQTAVEKEESKKIVSVEFDEIAAGILEVS